MRGVRPSPSLAALLAVGLAGCLNFAEPEPGPGHLEAFLDVRDEKPPSASVRARFYPGGTTDGSARAVEDPRIRILGAPVEPSEESGTLRWTYERNLEPGAGGLDRESVQLVGPRLAGDGTRAVLALPLVRRAGGDSIRWPVGEPLELPLEGVDEVHRETASERLRWTLRIGAAGGPDRLFTASGNGSLPDTLRVEEDAVSDASGPLEALLRVQLEGTTPPAASASAGYETVLQLTVRVVWTIGREPG